MGTNECSQPASKSSWDSQDFGDISMVLKMAHFRKSTGPRWVKLPSVAVRNYMTHGHTCCYHSYIMIEHIATNDKYHN